MGSFKSTIITKKGHNLMAKLTAGTAEMNFTKIRSSEHDYSALTPAELEALIEIQEIKQEISVSEVKRINDASVKVSGALSNTLLAEGYYLKTVALYANDPDEGEILYSVTPSILFDWMPPNNGVTSSSVLIDLITVVSNADNVSIEVDPNATVSITQFNEFKDQVNSSLSEKANQVDLDTANSNIALKANNTDSNRTTTDKTVTGAINELNTNKAEKTDVNNLTTIVSGKADKTQLTTVFNYKGSCTYSELGSKPQNLNDTWYVTDKGFNYSWNGTAWGQSGSDKTELVNLTSNTTAIPYNYNGSVTTDYTNAKLTFSGNIGFVRRGEVSAILIPAGSYTFTDTALAFVYDYNTSAFSFVKSQSLTEKMVVLAYRGSSDNIQSIWDGNINKKNIDTINTNITSLKNKAMYPFCWGDSDVPLKQGNSIVISSSAVGFLYDTSAYFIPIGTYTLTADSYLVYDYTSNTAKVVTRGNMLSTYVALAWYGSHLITIWDVIISERIIKPLRGKTITFLGDSITYGVGLTDAKNLYHALIAKETECTAINLGVSGTGICWSTDGNLGSGNSFLARYMNIDSASKYIVVFGGTNDYGSNTALGASTDTGTTTFCGALNNLINGLMTNYPNAKLLFVTPLRRNYNGVSGDTANTDGHTLGDYVSAMKTICSKYAIPVVDLYTESGLYPENSVIASQYFSTDKLHPNDNGHVKFYNLIEKKLLNI